MHAIICMFQCTVVYVHLSNSQACMCSVFPGIVCSALMAPMNFGRISYSPDTTDTYDVGTVATYSCATNFGYGLTRTNTRTCEDGDRLTTAGVWNGVAPTCDCEYNLLYNACI